MGCGCSASISSIIFKLFASYVGSGWMCREERERGVRAKLLVSYFFLGEVFFLYLGVGRWMSLFFWRQPDDWMEEKSVEKMHAQQK